MSSDRNGEAREAAGAFPRPISGAAELGCALASALALERRTSVPSSLSEPQPDRHAEVKCRFLVQPDLPREVVHELFDQLVIALRRRAPSDARRSLPAAARPPARTVIIVQRVEQFVVLRRALFLDVARSSDTGHDRPACRSARPRRARDPSGRLKCAHECLRGEDYYIWGSRDRSGSSDLADLGSGDRSRAAVSIVDRCRRRHAHCCRLLRSGRTCRTRSHLAHHRRVLRSRRLRRRLFPQMVDLAGSGRLSIASSPKGLGPAAARSSSTRRVSANILFEVVDRRRVSVVYSRGFASIYGEWETTPEFKQGNRIFPRVAAVSVAGRSGSRCSSRKRDAERCSSKSGRSTSTHSARCRRGTRAVRSGRLSPLFEYGPPHRKVDLLLISERLFGRGDRRNSGADAARLVERLFALEPFRSRRADFNVRCLKSPGPGAHRRSSTSSASSGTR